MTGCVQSDGPITRCSLKPMLLTWPIRPCNNSNTTAGVCTLLAKCKADGSAAPTLHAPLRGVFAVSRLMNHSCEPTVGQYEVKQLRGYFRLLFIAIAHIYPGDELTLDYSAPLLRVHAPLSRAACVCSCRHVV